MEGPLGGSHPFGRKRHEPPFATDSATLRLPWLLFWIASISMLGCQTRRSWQQGCPGVYSGIRYYGDQVGALPVDGKIFFTLDLPLTAVADTTLLPVSVFMKPKRPSYGLAPGAAGQRSAKACLRHRTAQVPGP